MVFGKGKTFNQRQGGEFLSRHSNFLQFTLKVKYSDLQQQSYN